MQDKKAIVLCANMYEERELWYPYYRLQEAGLEVELVGAEEGTYTGKAGLPCKVDKQISQINAEEVDAVIIPGGFAPDSLRRNQQILNVIKKVNNNGGLIAAICHGPWLLVSADIISGKHITCFWAIIDDVKNAGAHYEDREVIRDGNIVTSRIPHDLPEFMKECLTVLQD
ncbi:type 1 glutamine amidotransferase domain-containing protein [Natranaerobius thermophilus]|uniref:Intracellular protease, PfpI family n=1 Tax=Natranaerobius thermophilus (strain ATCC BAA-1301 / DSM 18059 / JW/NM-WN-LF) TaxID=457570 RepID=B2A567_NATTJ|nr:type 1 glutamine amidotransferase domain-containing protein [Natranaerobius thermophilus]ACB85308.1 intracellular protease, PfpI family [Natranaerobius thermophilus JW/NM-WN-LF]